VSAAGWRAPGYEVSSLPLTGRRPTKGNDVILVAFVLVLVATVMLIIGTFFDGGVAYIWISIGACVATFGVLAASYLARRRGADDQGARPQPLGAGESRPAAVQSGPRGTTVSGGGTATKVREEPDTDVAEDEADEPTVTIVPTEGDHEPDEQVAEEPVEDAEEEPAAEEAPEPAPRRVAPRRVVRSAAPAAPVVGEEDATVDEEEEQAEEAAPAWPSKVASAPPPAAEQAAADDAATDEASDDEAAEGTAAPATQGETRKVVRRVQPGGTRKVVRRAPGTGGSGATRKVVRRAGAAQAGQRTVKRVVRRAPSGTGQAAGDQAAEQQPETPTRRSGTRGKKARAVLSEIKGVGPAKQDALLKRFGSIEDMAEASIDDLAEVKGVGDGVAKVIKDALKAR